MKRLALIALVLTLALAGLAVAQTRIYTHAHGGRFPVAPAKLKYSTNDTASEQWLRLRHLRWQHWGGPKAVAHGQLKACSESAGCFRSGAKVKARKLQNSGRNGYYTRIAISFGQNRIRFPLPLAPSS